MLKNIHILKMNKNLFIGFFLILIFLNEKLLFADTIVFSCKISHEIENNKPSKSKNYSTMPILIFLNKKNKWINDLDKESWLKKEQTNENRIKYNLNENNYEINFKLFKYFSKSQNTVELVIELKFDKINKLINFVKYYYDFDENLLLETEVRGDCHQKLH